MGLREDRVLFTSLVVKVLQAIAERQWSYGMVEVAVDEWTVHPRRMYIDDETGERRTGTDRVHHPAGFHPKGLAVDLLVYIDDVYITSGSHPIWHDLDQIAQGLDPKLHFGIEFHDSNHLSLGELGSK